MRYVWYNMRKGGFLAVSEEQRWPGLHVNPFAPNVLKFRSYDEAERYLASFNFDESRLEKMALIQIQRIDNNPYEGASIERINALKEERK